MVPPDNCVEVCVIALSSLAVGKSCVDAGLLNIPNIVEYDRTAMAISHATEDVAVLERRWCRTWCRIALTKLLSGTSNLMVSLSCGT